MFRSLFGLIVATFQLIRNNIKPLILLASLATFIWLVVSTTSRPEFKRPASKHQKANLSSGLSKESELQPSNRWSESSVEIFLSLLDIDANVTSLVKDSQNEPCPLENEIIFTALAAGELEESLWQYYTLLAMRQNAKLRAEKSFQILPFLPKSTRLQLEEIFAHVPMEVIGSLNFDCYDLAGANIINSASEIDPPKRNNQIYILDTGTRRYGDLISADWNLEKPMLRPDEAEAAQTRLRKLLEDSPVQGYGQTTPEFVGIYIQRDDELPFEYYYRAVAFQRKLHSVRLIFLVICEDPQGAICQKLNAPKEEIHILLSAAGTNPALEFALMVACNHTIISNHMGIFHALANGGDVVVYEHEDAISRGHYLPWLMATEMGNWYMLR
ncbi:uncharacterized protein LOC129739622 [Uranotaenia lowii]|uniref:uncharacterized protein LOC129739622 n=1 Tax=Uranotaenia lowii TaxID=190385 RepID=UPI0024793E32|nr:uncharacterized protein LOC129739622 [Uranotaenia lowii]